MAKDAARNKAINRAESEAKNDPEPLDLDELERKLATWRQGPQLIARVRELEAKTAQVEALERARGALACFFLPQISRGPGYDGWLDAAAVYLDSDPTGEEAEEIKRLYLLARALDDATAATSETESGE